MVLMITLRVTRLCFCVMVKEWRLHEHEPPGSATARRARALASAEMVEIRRALRLAWRCRRVAIGPVG